MQLDRLSVHFTISRAKRLYHGLPFVIFALDLRDSLGLYLTRLLHGMGDVKSVAEIRRRAERRERAPVVCVPTSLPHLRDIVAFLEKSAQSGMQWECTAGDVTAVRFFARGARGIRDCVPVFLAADDERSVFRFPLHRRQAPAEPLQRMAPAIFMATFGHLADSTALVSNDIHDDNTDDLIIDSDRFPGLHPLLGGDPLPSSDALLSGDPINLE